MVELPQQHAVSAPMRKRRIMKLMLLSVVVVLVVGSVGVIAFHAGFLPINEFLSIKEPAGSAVPLSVAGYMQAYPELAQIPNLDQIKYEAFGTDASLSLVFAEYDDELRNEGYHREYQGTGQFGDALFEFAGYLKGLTAVGIIALSGASDYAGHETVVFYSTGNALEFQAMLEWYENAQ
ncbi:MAG: hypothetical protein JW771_05530 [Candidatus Thermoplasmatota archaeon]|nr:hypothetical protein [Candidatus Thermoplasmatota archaeon]